MKRQINYRGLFVTGCTLMAAGVVLSITIGTVGISILGVGIALMAVGLANRDDWDKEE